jgi:prepilin-type N-terminal cleavage/methylation domain-containing protein
MIRKDDFKLLQYRAGFTLIELLVVISIIALLSVITLVSYKSVVQSGRDAKRQSDLKSIQSALEQYRVDQHNYPTSIDFSAGTNLSGGGKIYISTLPKDPNNTINQYKYNALPSGCINDPANPSTKCTSYCLFAKLENTNNLPPSSTVCTDGSYNYSVGRP